jgi:pimeloyl-ACP methyl ester carboxylesterase
MKKGHKNTGSSTMIQTTTGFLDMGDGMMYYETAGVGEPLVLSHAAFLDSRMFDAQWEPLAQYFQVIRYDMRGFGQSSAVNGPLCRRADLRCLLEHLGVKQAHLVGCSNGGTLMLDLVLEQPETALSLTLVGSAPSGFEEQGEAPRYMWEMFEAMQNGDVERANELQIRIWLDGSLREPIEIDGEVREKALVMNHIPVERQTFLIADMQPLCPLDPPALTRLHEVQCPVLVITGALDHPEILRAADMIGAQVPNTRKAMIKAAGHVPSFEQPAEFNALLLDFLDKGM